MKNKNRLRDRNIILIILIVLNLFIFGIKLEFDIATFLEYESPLKNYLFLLPEIIIIISSLIYLIKIMNNIEGPEVGIKNIVVNNVLIMGSITLLFLIIWFDAYAMAFAGFGTDIGEQIYYFQYVSFYVIALVMLNVTDILFKVVYLYNKDINTKIESSSS